MRLAEVERGDTPAHRLLIRMISRMAGYRLPDAARVAFYDKAFAGPALGRWTQRAMRGPSPWTVSERELMAAMVASWNSCPFCVGAHRAIAVRGMDPAVADAALADFRAAPIGDRLRSALVFLERMTTDPDGLGAGDARAALAAGLTAAELEDVAAVGAVFAIITRNANALDFEIPSAADFDSAAAMLLRRGYA
ncbi:carboxymuconolactone decarboxylase family protein [Microbacterium sp. NPDC057659]|uniref:carboxymuconolactone decarboxylase family protein n=1 Tax=Microbacterium sp. NPDC057659 TaxID=3346198 RepID=UPI00366FBE16